MTGPNADIYVSTKCQDGEHDACPVLRKSNRVPCSCDDPDCDHAQALGPTATTRAENAHSRVGYAWRGAIGLRRDLVDAVAARLVGYVYDEEREDAAWHAVYAVLDGIGSVPASEE